MAMNTNVPALPLGNTTAELEALVGTPKQLVVDTDKNAIVVMDGVTPGGHPHVLESRKLLSASAALTLNDSSEADLSGDVTIGIDDVTDNFITELTAVKGVIASAQEAGQIGDTPFLGNVDADTLTEPGLYYVNMVSSADYDVFANHWPMELWRRTLVSVYKDTSYGANDTIQEIIIDGAGIRRSGNSGDWNKWLPFYIAKAELTIYISKSGDDKGFGLDAAYPVQSIGRAVEIASAVHFSTANGTVNFRFGTGDWGNVTFTSLPFHLNITKYDGNTATEYSDELPQFGFITIKRSYVTLSGICAADVTSTDMSYVNWLIGYRRATAVRALGCSALVFQSQNSDTNVIEFVDDERLGNDKGFICSAHSLLHTYDILVKLGENISGSRFVYNYMSTMYLVPGHFMVETNGYTFTGQKYFLTSLSMSWTSLELLDALPGTQTGGLTAGANINGNEIQGPLWAIAGSDANAFEMKSAVMELGIVPAANAFLIMNWRDKNDVHLGTMLCAQYADGRQYMGFEMYHAVGIGQGVTVWRLADGACYAVAPSTPSGAPNNAIVTKGAVNSVMGTSSALTALASADPADENYVETIEIMRDKAISELNVEVQQAIYAGFPYEIDGTEYRIGYSLFDQNNLNSDAIVAAQNPGKTMSFRCMDETGHVVWLDISTETVLAIQKYGVISHRDAIRKAADEKKARILEAQNDAEIKQIIME